MSAKIIGGAAGAAIGASIGSSIGIAGFGGAIAGTLPLLLLGAYLGYRAGVWTESKLNNGR